MTRTHCDNCDVVTDDLRTPDALRSVLRDGTIVSVDTIIYHPVTQRRLELCTSCAQDLINTATQPYMALKS